MKEIANRICEALMYAEVVDSQYQFSTDWLGKSKSYLGMFTVRGHPVAWLQIRNRCADIQHLTHIAVAEGQGFIEPAAHGLDRGHETVGLRLVESHAHLVGLLAGFLNEIGLAKVDQHALRAGGDQRARGADEDVSAPKGGARRIRLEAS